MKEAELVKLSSIWLPAITLALLVSSGIVFAHGDEEHERAETVSQVSLDSVTAAQAEVRDSIFGIIQEGFARLEPTFKKGCFDCHTTNTVYPWYYKLPIVKGILDDHIKDGLKHLDMTDGFPFKGHGAPADDLEAIREEVLEGEMPLLSYRMLHWSAKPSDNEIDSIATWVDRSLASLATIGEVPKEQEEHGEEGEGADDD